MSKINFSRESFSQIFEQIETLKSYYHRLSDRERYIVLGSAMAGYILFLFLIYMLVASTVSSVQSKIDANKKGVVEIEELRTSLQNSKNAVDDIEQRIRRTEVGFQLATELERIAGKYGVSIDTLSDRPGQPNDLYNEIQSTIKVSSIDLKTLIHFLYDIEHGNKLIRISSLQIKPNYKDSAQLNVSFVVSTFKLKASS